MVVNFTVTDPSTFALKADTPFDTIKEAANAGRIVYASVPEPVGPLFGQLTSVSPSGIVFNAFNGNTTIMTITMESDSDIHGTMNVLLSRLVEGLEIGDFDADYFRIKNVKEPTEASDAATKGYVDKTLTAGNSDSVVIKSSTPNSTKKFRITVDDAGAISATEVVS